MFWIIRNQKCDIIEQAMKNQENHCCDKLNIPIDTYLQIGNGIGQSLLVVGESPSLNGWMKSGRAFYTIEGKVVPTGVNFLVNLKQISPDLELGNISFTEISKCYIGINRNKLDNCAKKTWPNFIEQINYVNPNLIILLGKKTADIFNKLTTLDLKVGELTNIKIDDKVRNILPIYHPSPLNPKRIQNVEFIDSNLTKIKQLLNQTN
ncbi:MAG: uracil-DNA glycosylase family protein [Ignavibacteria bacterium]|nr:uracil-DNA glycosylase family protein [Ignavibacteria bacterium]